MTKMAAYITYLKLFHDLALMTTKNILRSPTKKIHLQIAAIQNQNRIVKVTLSYIEASPVFVALLPHLHHLVDLCNSGSLKLNFIVLQLLRIVVNCFRNQHIA